MVTGYGDSVILGFKQDVFGTLILERTILEQYVVKLILQFYLKNWKV